MGLRHFIGVESLSWRTAVEGPRSCRQYKGEGVEIPIKTLRKDMVTTRLLVATGMWYRALARRYNACLNYLLVSSFGGMFFSSYVGGYNRCSMTQSRRISLQQRYGR